MINTFENIKSPNVLDEIDVYDFIDRIKNPEENIKQKIQEARSCHISDKSKYDDIKSQLPCFTLNFSFVVWKANKNIKESTGFIYLDLDGSTEIDLTNNLIFASWKSLSNRGRGVLVKVDCLTLDNFKDCYLAVAKELNLIVDKLAGKPTQYNIHSFDENIYFNEDSETFLIETINVKVKNTPSMVTINKKEERVSTVMGEKQKIRFNNISDYDFKGEDYLVFWENKEWIAEAYPNRLVLKGMRESCLSTFAYQLKALNPEMSWNVLHHFVSIYNKRKCFPPLADDEISRIVNSKDKLIGIEPIYNKPRRVIFNPNKKLSRLEKTLITNKLLGSLKTDKSRRMIAKFIESWNFDLMGKINQVRLAKESGLNIKTIEKYYKEFKNEIKKINLKLLVNESIIV